jgi:hypothetical protein
LASERVRARRDSFGTEMSNPKMMTATAKMAVTRAKL